MMPPGERARTSARPMHPDAERWDSRKLGVEKLERNYPRYHEMEAASPGKGRAAVVELRVDGWSAKTIAGYRCGLPGRSR
jgi:hypothetical protein